MAAELPVLHFESGPAWSEWLEDNHDSVSGVWLKIAKKGSGTASVTYDDALSEALCFGWIDGQKKTFDESWWLQRFSRRTSRSKWSKINREKAEGLLSSGAMRPAGQREVDAAKADGRWAAAYDGQRTAEVPDDLAAALAEQPVARTFFDTLNSRNRYAVLHRVQDAKKPETRERRIRQLVEMLAEEKKLYP